MFSFKNSKTKITILNTAAVILIALTASSCLTAGASESAAAGDSEKQLETGPDWLRKPPLNSEYIYGVGCAEDEAKAKQLALINAAAQFSTHIKSEIRSSSVDGGFDSTQALSTFDEQITDYTLRGAKFADRYIDEESNLIYILAEAPLQCLLDGTENILISYLLVNEPVESPPPGTEPGTPPASPAENLERRRAARIILASQKIPDFQQILNTENVTGKLEETGYITPGYFLNYRANGGGEGRPPIDGRLYEKDAVAAVSGNTGHLSNNGSGLSGWTLSPGGAGTLLTAGTLLKFSDSDIYLYARYDEDPAAQKGGKALEKLIIDRRNITVDGKLDDWIESSPVHTDAQNEVVIKEVNFDIAAVHFASDNKYLYIMIRTTELPVPKERVLYEFDLFNCPGNAQLDFSISGSGGTVRNVELKKGYWPGSGTSSRFTQMEREMKIKSSDVIEFAIPLSLMRISKVYADELRFNIRISNSRTDYHIDETKAVYIVFAGKTN